MFKSIAETNRGFAEKCFPVALESLVFAKEFSLARSFMVDARSEVDRFAKPFKTAPVSTPSASEGTIQETLARIYVKNVGLLLKVLSASLVVCTVERSVKLSAKMQR